MDNIEIIKSLVTVEAYPTSNGKYSYIATAEDGTSYHLAQAAARRENVFFYSGHVNGNCKVFGSLNGHCTYGKNPTTGAWARDRLIRGIKVTFPEDGKV